MDVLIFGVVYYKFGSRMMNGISKQMAQGFILVMLFMMVMILVASLVMVMVVCFSLLVVMVRHKAVGER